MIRVSSREEAWRLADRLFPSDYEQEPFDKEIGYAIYRSTKPGESAWISDLGSRLELNYPNGSSENVWIETFSRNEYPFSEIVDGVTCCCGYDFGTDAAVARFCPICGKRLNQ